MFHKITKLENKTFFTPANHGSAIFSAMNIFMQKVRVNNITMGIAKSASCL
ncbi:MAG: hypothetical protein AAB503_00130 [Patescibacteria group bacterium]